MTCFASFEWAEFLWSLSKVVVLLLPQIAQMAGDKAKHNCEALNR